MSCAPCQADAPPLGIPGTYATSTEPAPPPPQDAAGWEGILGFEGVLTGDSRLIERNALVWDTPLPLRFVKEDVGGHQNAVVVGRIEAIARGQGGAVEASGVFDLGSEDGREAARLVGEEFQNWVSLDLDEVFVEFRIAEELLDPERDDPPAERDADGRVVVDRYSPDDHVEALVSARVRGATLVQISAFRDARVNLTSDTPDTPGGQGEGGGLVAAGAPPAPPAAWFEDPRLDGPTPVTVTDDGRIFGHMAAWDTCHISFTQAGRCVPPPRSGTEYAHFRLGATHTREGTVVPTGVVTLNTRHAAPDATAAGALAHYEDTGLAAADVAVGEDQWGIWVAGATRTLDPGVLRALRASPLSGDWRAAAGGLEMVAVLAVNTPGFPIPRPAALVASGAVVSLTAAGMVSRGPRATAVGALAEEDARYLSRVIARERERDRGVVDQMAARLRASGAAALRARVDATRGA